MRNRPQKVAPQVSAANNPPAEPVVRVSPAEPKPGDILLVNDVAVVGSAIASRRSADIPAPQMYRVVVPATIMYRGSRVQLRAGKIVDERSYSIDWLREQGVRLVRVED
jgi:hypothetical protein